ncbi:MAG: FHA domain-containing protein [Chloroflexota bacterium]|nr:FHA domain-containing protein [Dehalococcoidia bacterium]MDW8252402.1 FHA domain-containing protein [Chloroflexota bacterium]
MISDVGILGLRLLFVVLLYAFLAQIVFLLWRDLQNRAGASGTSTAGAILRVVDGARSGLKRGAILPLSPETTVGRAPGSGLVLPDETVSSRHALLRRVDGRWWVEDLGSTNGTRVNGRPIRTATVVVPGDLLEFGGVRLRLERAG